MFSERLVEISHILQPHQDAFDAIWDNAELYSQQELEESSYNYNEKIGPYIDEIAILSGNTIDTIRSAFKPKRKYDLWFHPNDPAAMIRNLGINGAWR